MSYNIKTRINNAGKLIIIVDPNQEPEEAQSGKSVLLAHSRWLDLSDVDESLDGYKLNLILSKSIKDKKKIKSSKRDDDDGDIDEDDDSAPAKKRGRPAKAKTTAKTSAKRGRPAKEEPAKKRGRPAKAKSITKDLEDLDEDELASLFESVTEKDASDFTATRMIRLLKRENVVSATIEDDEVTPNYEAEENDDSDSSPDADEEEEVAPPRRASLGRAGKIAKKKTAKRGR